MALMVHWQMFMYEKKMEWKGGDVPISEPACGFNGEKCQLKLGKWRSPLLSDIAYTVCTINLIFFLEK